MGQKQDSGDVSDGLSHGNTVALRRIGSTRFSHLQTDDPRQCLYVTVSKGSIMTFLKRFSRFWKSSFRVDVSSASSYFHRLLGGNLWNLRIQASSGRLPVAEQGVGAAQSVAWWQQSCGSPCVCCIHVDLARQCVPSLPSFFYFFY